MTANDSSNRACSPALPPSLVAKYVLVKKLAAGGMGSVFIARHKQLDRPAAVKFLQPDGVDMADLYERFEAEAQICSNLNHPNILKIFDFDAHSTPPYIVFELIEGGSLRDHIQRGRRPSLPAACALMAQIYEGLGHAHERGVVHRDIKPENILLTKRRVPKIADFGLAKLSQRWSSGVRTKTGLILGTPMYMSPEQATGRPIGQAADVYALACVFFELLTGRLPFRGSNFVEILNKHIKDEAPRLKSLIVETPKLLDDLLFHSMAKDPSERPQDCTVVAEQLRSLRSQLRFRSSRGTAVQQNPLGSSGAATIDVGSAVDVAAATDSSRGATGSARGAMTLEGSAAKDSARTQLTPSQAIAAGRPHRSEGTRNQRRAGRGSSAATPRQTAAIAPAMHSSTEVAIQAVRERPWLPLAAGAAVILVSVLLSTLLFGNRYEIKQLTIDAVGATALQLSWRGSSAIDEPRVLLNGVERTATLLTEVDDGNRGSNETPIVHNAIITGLTPTRRYEVALCVPGGGHSVALTARTVAAAFFAPTVRASFPSENELLVTINSSIPCALQLVRQGTERATVARSYRHEHQLTCSLAELTAQPPFELVLSAIDDGERRYLLAECLRKELDRVYRAFENDRRHGSYYDMWTDVVPETDVKKNLLTGAVEHYHMLRANKGSEAAARYIETFWSAVRKSLKSNTRWFTTFEPLLKGLATLSTVVNLPSPLRQGLTRALLPLELVNSGAVRVGLPRHPLWEQVEQGCRPYDLRYDPPDHERRGKAFPCRNNSSLPFLVPLLADHYHPSRTILYGKFPAALQETQQVMQLKVDIPALRLKAAAQAYLELNLRSCWISHRLLADLNEGAFFALFRDRSVDWQAAQAFLDGSNPYVKMGTIGLQLMMSGTSDEELEQTAYVMGELYPERVRSVWHPIDSATLNAGENTIAITMVLTPTRSDPDPPFITGANVWLVE